MFGDFTKRPKERQGSSEGRPRTGEEKRQAAHRTIQGAKATPFALDIREYAARMGMSEDAVWQRIGAGELVARQIGGRLYVITKDELGNGGAEVDGSWQADKNSDSSAIYDAEYQDEQVKELPPLPPANEERPGASTMLTQVGGGVTDVALLLDHLSLAKEENKEILRLSQDSITRITSMTDSIVAVKDELLAHKNDQIGRLQAELTERGRLIHKLRQEVEDLEILVKTLNSK